MHETTWATIGYIRFIDCGLISVFTDESPAFSDNLFDGQSMKEGKVGNCPPEQKESDDIEQIVITLESQLLLFGSGRHDRWISRLKKRNYANQSRS
jgi:hypothetical protein